ncbi:hypothetical protein [Sutcliffiella rhizosphaerae]|uniref:hypothetical protein n=1 Tax=Sutcliffiella rhizosphaerae TaxID=2880967 RepID=UPI001E3F70AB|nr:hypothetical protein [Sutcliffiella rhizosphaerae]
MVKLNNSMCLKRGRNQSLCGLKRNAIFARRKSRTFTRIKKKGRSYIVARFVKAMQREEHL